MSWNRDGNEREFEANRGKGLFGRTSRASLLTEPAHRDGEGAWASAKLV